MFTLFRKVAGGRHPKIILYLATNSTAQNLFRFYRDYNLTERLKFINYREKNQIVQVQCTKPLKYSIKFQKYPRT